MELIKVKIHVYLGHESLLFCRDDCQSYGGYIGNKVNMIHIM